MEDKAAGFVEGLFEKAKAVRIEGLLAKLGIALEQHGDELRGVCPIPAHVGAKKKPSFYIKPSEQVFHCFGCKEGGNIVKFAMAYLGLQRYESKKAALWIVDTMECRAPIDVTASQDFPEKLDVVARELGTTLEQAAAVPVDDELLLKLFTLAGEQLIEAAAKNPKAVAEKLARWVVVVLKC
jgi:hypothetical protein